MSEDYADGRYLDVNAVLDCNGAEHDDGETQADGTITVLPNELITHVFHLSCEVDGVDDLDAWLQHRDSLLKVSRDYVLNHPAFWTHLLVSADTIDLVPEAISAADGHPLYLTVFIPDSDAIPDSIAPPVPQSEESEDELDLMPLYLDRLAEVVGPVLSQCSGLSIESSSFSAANSLMLRLQLHHPTIMDYTSITYAFSDFFDYPNRTFAGYAFASGPAYGCPFTPSTAITIEPSDLAVTTVTRVSSSSSYTIIRQAVSCPMQWEDAIDVLDPYGSVETVTLRDVRWSTAPFGPRISCPFSTVHKVDIAFCGNTDMVDLAAHLNLPCLRDLTVRLSCRADVDSLSACGAILSVVTCVRIFLDYACPVSVVSVLTIPFHRIFGMLYCVERLDVSCPILDFFSLFKLASRQSHVGVGKNWAACPALEHLCFHSVSLQQLRDLICIRRMSGYRPLKTISTRGILHADGPDIRAWLRDENLMHMLMDDPPVKVYYSRIYIYIGWYFCVVVSVWMSSTFVSDASLITTSCLRRPSTRSRFPFEILVQILVWACGRYFDGRDAFVKMSGMQTAGVWASYSLRPSLLRSSTDLWISRIADYPISLRIVLDMYHLNSPPGVDYVTFEEMLAITVRQASRCRSLRIEADDSPRVQLLLSALSECNWPRLTNFALISIPFSRPHSPLLAIQPEQPGMSAHAHSLLALRLTGMVFSWIDTQCYASLTMLILDKFVESVAPTVRELHGILTSSTQLRRLSISDIDCPGSPNHLLPPIHLPFLESLDLAVGGNEGLGSIVEQLVIPSLKSLWYLFGSVYDMNLLLNCGEMLAPISRFTAAGYNRDRRGDSVLDLLALMPHIVHVGLAHVDDGFLQCMVDAPTNGLAPIWPGLRSINLGEPRVSHVIKFLTDRTPACARLESLRVYRIYPESFGPGEEE
ncbi:hypothetical protein C8R44DRAFT_741953 [Mycena epipterygia]|nr:hypothetical protein C8R44DRAFT_741953 [Mycena epipterygia]